MIGMPEDFQDKMVDYDLRKLQFPFAIITVKGYVLFTTNEERAELGIPSSNISRWNITDSVSADIHASLKQFLGNPVNAPIERRFGGLPFDANVQRKVRVGVDIVLVLQAHREPSEHNQDGNGNPPANYRQTQVINVEAKPVLVVMVRIAGLRELKEGRLLFGRFWPRATRYVIRKEPSSSTVGIE